jgi:hypothetical protein
MDCFCWLFNCFCYDKKRIQGDLLQATRTIKFGESEQMKAKQKTLFDFHPVTFYYGEEYLPDSAVSPSPNLKT